MKAVVVNGFGGPEVLRVGEVPDPLAGPGQVRVAVHAAGTNPVDAGNRADGAWAGLRPPASSATTSPASSTRSATASTTCGSTNR
jgi:NADPH:quinone reductase-like Zn-dependent oxidoreductase